MKKVISEQTINLDIIKGYNEEKKAVKNIINLLNNYDKYEKQGVNIPRGLIFQGPPGTGKTLFAKAIAGECHYKFYNAFTSELNEHPLDTLKKVFNEAEKNSEKNNTPSLIYIDELDKLAYMNKRGELDPDARDAVRFLLQKLDETKFRNKILIIASTNNYRMIPEALLRSGRFDKKILIDIPDQDSREEILKLYINNHPLFKNINVTALAMKTNGMSGADLKTLINNTLLEYITVKDQIEIDDFIKIINEMNFETIGKKWNNDENALEVLAHEVGHALVAYVLCGNFGTVSALRYGYTAGSTDISDDYLYDDDEELPDCSEERMKNAKDTINDIIVTLGGKAGEKVYLNQESTGILSDLNTISRELELLFDNCVYGFKPCRSWYHDGVEDRYFRYCRSKSLRLVKKYYKKALNIVKKNKVLGLYLIDEIHKNNDVLSNAELIKRVNRFNEDKNIRKKYKCLNYNELKNK